LSSNLSGKRSLTQTLVPDAFTSSVSDSVMVTLGIVNNLNPVSPRSQSPVPVDRLDTNKTGK
jgi:hypothetical protein